MTQRKQPDDLDALLDRLEDVAVATSFILRPKVTVVATKRSFEVSVDWRGAVDWSSTQSPSEDVQHVMTELEQHHGTAMPTKITIPRK